MNAKEIVDTALEALAVWCAVSLGLGLLWIAARELSARIR